MERTGPAPELPIESHADSSVEYATPFLWRNGEVDVRCFRDREPTQYRVAVGTAPSYSNVGKVRAMAVSEGLSQNVGLSLCLRTFGVLVHFLKQKQIGVVVCDDFSDASSVMTSVGSTDALMDVVCQESEYHACPFANGRRISTDDDSSRVGLGQGLRHTLEPLGTDAISLCR